MEKVQKQSPISNSDYVDFLKEQLSAFEEFERRLVATDPEEIHDLSKRIEFVNICNELKADLYNICDPEEMNKIAFKDQDEMIEKYGGIEAAGNLGATGATPPPK